MRDKEKTHFFCFLFWLSREFSTIDLKGKEQGLAHCYPTSTPPTQVNLFAEDLLRGLQKALP